MGYQDVAFLPSQAGFYTAYLNIVVEVKASGPPRIFKLWLGVGRGMHPVR